VEPNFEFESVISSLDRPLWKWKIGIEGDAHSVPSALHALAQVSPSVRLMRPCSGVERTSTTTTTMVSEVVLDVYSLHLLASAAIASKSGPTILLMSLWFGSIRTPHGLPPFHAQFRIVCRTYTRYRPTCDATISRAASIFLSYILIIISSLIKLTALQHLHVFQVPLYQQFWRTNIQGL